jgi:hypothetical protein
MPDAKNDATLDGSHGRIVLRNALGITLQGSLEVVSETVQTTMAYEPDTLALSTRPVEAFNRAIQHYEEPTASGLDGLRAVHVTEAMIASATRGRTVTLEPRAVSRATCAIRCGLQSRYRLKIFGFVAIYSNSASLKQDWAKRSIGGSAGINR